MTRVKCIPVGGEQNLRLHDGEHLHHEGDDPGPTGLVAGADAGAVVAVEVFVKENVVAPVGIVLELARAAIDGSMPVLVFEEDVAKATGDFLGDLEEVELTARAGGEVDFEI